MFGALSDPTRRALLAAIAEQPAATATQLASELPISRQAVVKHLNALTDAGLLDRTRAGREVRYQFTPAPLSDAVGWMAEVGAEWDDRLAVLRRQLGTDVQPGPLGVLAAASAAEFRGTAQPTRRSAGRPARPPSRRRSIRAAD